MDKLAIFKEIKTKQPFYQINPNMYMIFQEKTSVNFNSCNTFLIREGQEVTLVDPGCSRHHLLKLLKTLNIELTHIKNIILTHAHSDHYVNVKYLKKKADPDVYIHHADREFLINLDKYIDLLFDRKFFQNRSKFHEFFRILEYFAHREKFSANSKTLNLNPVIKGIFDTWNIYQIIPDREYSDNEKLPGELKAIHLPGHTPGHCGLLSSPHSLIFCADIDFNKRGPVVSSKYANINAYKLSLKKLRRFIRTEKITQLFPSHWNPIFSKLEQKIEEFYSKIEQKQQELLGLLSKKARMTLEEISSETFKNFAKNFTEFIDGTTRDSLLVAEASDLLTNRNYLNELKLLKKVTTTFHDNEEYWSRLYNSLQGDD
ncbi:MAG: MBL fold metallo-hydrolase [Candidatus Helarchaeota archaeon]